MYIHVKVKHRAKLTLIYVSTFKVFLRKHTKKNQFLKFYTNNCLLLLIIFSQNSKTKFKRQAYEIGRIFNIIFTLCESVWYTEKYKCNYRLINCFVCRRMFQNNFVAFRESQNHWKQLTNVASWILFFYFSLLLKRKWRMSFRHFLRNVPNNNKQISKCHNK